MTRAPRIRAGAISAEKMGTVAFFAPIPIPMTNRAAKRPCHDRAKPEPIGVAVRQQAVRKISPRRPKYLLSGSTMKAPLSSKLVSNAFIEPVG